MQPPCMATSHFTSWKCAELGLPVQAHEDEDEEIYAAYR